MTASVGKLAVKKRASHERKMKIGRFNCGKAQEASAGNVPGDFFVDSTCIDCDACRQIAPLVFGEATETSFVKAQPAADRRQALRAILACPTGSIGYCWYSWPQQAESMERQADYPFEWVLPGHGQKVHLPAAEMREQTLRLVESMRERRQV